MKRANSKGRRDTVQSFAGIPRKVMLSDDFRAIGPNAVRVLLWMSFQYRGENNGYLSATRQQAQQWGIGGADTLRRALEELEAHELIVLTRQGRFMNPGGSPNLYALTWLPVDEKPERPIDRARTDFPIREEWRRGSDNKAPGPVLKNVAPVTGARTPTTCNKVTPIAPVSGAKTRRHPHLKRDTLLSYQGVVDADAGAGSTKLKVAHL